MEQSIAQAAETQM